MITSPADQPDPDRGYFRLTAVGSGLALAGQLVKVIAGLALLVAVGSQLSPNQLGLASIALLALTGAAALTDVGLRDIVLVSKSPSQDRGIAGLAFVVALLASLVTVVSAPLIVVLTGDSRALPLILAVAPIAGLQVLVVAYEGVYRRALAFRPLILRGSAAIALGTVAAVGAALLGAGPWALLMQPAIEYAILLVALIVGPVKPIRPSLNRADLRAAWEISRPLAGTAAVVFAYTNLDDLVVARLVGTTGLGRYNLAYRISNGPTYLFTHGTSTVLAPVLRRIGPENPARLGAAYLRQLRAISLISGLALTGLIVMGPEIVARAFGDRWEGTSVTLRILCIYGLVRSVGATTGGLFIATGRLATIRRVAQWPTLVMLLLIVPLTATWGTAGAATAVTAPLAVATVVALVIAARAASLSPALTLATVGRQWLAASGVAAVGAGVAWTTGGIDGPGLVPGLVAFALAAAVCAVVGLRSDLRAFMRPGPEPDPPGGRP